MKNDGPQIVRHGKWRGTGIWSKAWTRSINLARRRTASENSNSQNSWEERNQNILRILLLSIHFFPDCLSQRPYSLGTLVAAKQTGISPPAHPPPNLNACGFHSSLFRGSKNWCFISFVLPRLSYNITRIVLSHNSDAVRYCTEAPNGAGGSSWTRKINLSLVNKAAKNLLYWARSPGLLSLLCENGQSKPRLALVFPSVKWDEQYAFVRFLSVFLKTQQGKMPHDYTLFLFWG